MSEKIDRDLLDEIERETPIGLNIERDPNSPTDTVRVIGYQRSEDTERRDENRNKLEKLRRELQWGEADDNWPVEVSSIGDIHSRYSCVFIQVEIDPSSF